ncbi:MAG: sirohydrochlorin chelatase [Bacteroidota bacterium]
MNTALILFAHGARDPEWASPMRRVQAAIRARLPALPVELAFLEFMTPSLTDCVAELIGRGAQELIVLPIFIARGGHLKRDLPEMLDVLRLAYPGVSFSLAGAVGEHEMVIQAIAEVALSALAPVA